MLQQALDELSQQIRLRPRYDNFIGGRWIPPAKGQYFTNLMPVTGMPLCEAARSTAEDIELALDAAHAAREKWGSTPAAERALYLNKIADRMESNHKLLAMLETLDNGKPIREALAADLPLAIDQFRYFAGVIRAREGSLSEIDKDTVGYHFQEPLGVVARLAAWANTARVRSLEAMAPRMLFRSSVGMCPQKMVEHME